MSILLKSLLCPFQDTNPSEETPSCRSKISELQPGQEQRWCASLETAVAVQYCDFIFRTTSADRDVVVCKKSCRESDDSSRTSAIRPSKDFRQHCSWKSLRWYISIPLQQHLQSLQHSLRVVASLCTVRYVGFRLQRLRPETRRVFVRRLENGIPYSTPTFRDLVYHIVTTLAFVITSFPSTFATFQAQKCSNTFNSVLLQH